MLLTASLLGLITYGLAKQEGERERDEEKGLGNGTDAMDLLNDRQTFQWDMPRYWEKMKEIGNWPWQTPLFKAPITTNWTVYAPPKNAELVDWEDPMSWNMRTEEKKRNFQANYKDAYSTELAYAINHQLVYGFWHETITKGPIANQTCRADGVYDHSGFNLYEYSAT